MSILDSNAIASTAFSQFGGNRAVAMIGIYNTSFSKEGTVSFRFKAKALNKSNHIYIKYNKGIDLYTLVYGRIYGNKYRILKEVSNVYGDMLSSNFEHETGLYLSL